MWHHFASAHLWVGVRWCHTLMNYGEKFHKPSGGGVWCRTVVVRVGDALERFQTLLSPVAFQHSLRPGDHYLLEAFSCDVLAPASAESYAPLMSIPEIKDLVFTPSLQLGMMED